MQKRIALIYGTTEGQTRKIAEHVAQALRKAGADVALMHAAELPLDWTPANSDAIVVAASVHQAQVQPYVRDFVERHADDLNAMPTALVLVSLNAALGEMADVPPPEYAKALRDQTGWSPTVVEHAAGALRYTEYNWLKRMVMRKIAGDQGMSTDTSRDVEFTDWEALDRFAKAFHDVLRTA
ncbi:MAG: protoporphyrinogen oxidase [Deltaproteobacteria bacterium]|nr:MAG: protoporphyrinogen oxidase [Deltaproteobacteria bacterium]